VSDSVEKGRGQAHGSTAEGAPVASSPLIAISPLTNDQVRTVLVMLSREGQAAITRHPQGPALAAECFEAAASLARDYRDGRQP
jgi:hypothetical protein